VIQQQLKRQQAVYSSTLHQNVVYVCCLHITLIHAQNVNVLFDSYFSIIGFVMVEIFALLHGEALVTRYRC